MRSLWPGVVIRLAWVIAASPAADHRSSKIERGYYSRDAIVVCSPPENMAPRRIPSPDGSKVIVEKWDRNSDLPHSIVTVEAFGKSFETDFASSPDCELAWSPDSRAFFVTYTQGGAVVYFVTKIFFVNAEGFEMVEPTKEVAKQFMSVPHYCYWDEDPNLASIAWLGDSSRMLVAAEFLPHSNCEEMGMFRAYEITVPQDREIVRPTHSKEAVLAASGPGTPQRGRRVRQEASALRGAGR